MRRSDFAARRSRNRCQLCPVCVGTGRRPPRTNQDLRAPARIFTACCAFVASIRAVWPPYRGAQRLEICPHIPSALGCHWHGRAPAHWAASHGRSELAPAGRQRDRGFSFGGAPVHQQGRRGWPREVDRVVCRAVAAHIRLA